MKRDLGGSSSAQCSAASLRKAGVGDLEEMEWFSPKKPSGDQDALLQTPGRGGDGPHV